MRAERGGSVADTDVGVYSSSEIDEIDDAEQPLVDLRTRLVLWILCLFFLSLLYLGLNGAPV